MFSLINDDPRLAYYFVRWRKFRACDCLQGPEESNVVGIKNTFNPKKAFDEIKCRLIEDEDDRNDIGVNIIEFRRM